MKSFLEKVIDDDPKTVEKFQKAIEKNGISGTAYETFRTEVRAGNAAEFKNLSIIVTDSYICNYNPLVISFNLIPISSVTRLYRTNIRPDGYSFEWFWLKIEMSNGTYDLLSSQMRNSANSPKILDVYNDVIADVMRRKEGIAL